MRVDIPTVVPVWIQFSVVFPLAGQISSKFRPLRQVKGFLQVDVDARNALNVARVEDDAILVYLVVERVGGLDRMTQADGDFVGRGKRCENSFIRVAGFGFHFDYMADE